MEPQPQPQPQPSPTPIPQRIPDEAVQFLRALFGGATGHITFQTFAERKEDKDDENRKRALARQFHCDARNEQSWHDLAGALYALNEDRAGVYVTVNVTDGTGRKEDNVLAITALFIDHDEQKDGPLKNQIALPPSITVRTARGWHHYWLMQPGQPQGRFKDVQQHLIRYYRSDKSVHDLPRVMRLPGFLHWKAEPTPVRLERCDPTVRYTMDEVLAAHPMPAAPAQPTVSYGGAAATPATPATPATHATHATPATHGKEHTDPADFTKVMERCAVMRHVRDNAATVAYELWFKTVGVATHCADGPRHAHELSKLDPARYTEADTQQKIDDYLKAGPTRCQTLCDAGGEPLCKECPHYQKITSPIELGRDRAVLKPEDLLAEHDRKAAEARETAQQTAKAEAEALLARVKSQPDRQMVFSAGKTLALLATGDYAWVIAELKDIFDAANKALNMNHLGAVVTEERRKLEDAEAKACERVQAQVDAQTAQAEAEEAEAYDDRGLPFIPVRDRKISDITTDCVDALKTAQGEPTLFRRDNHLVEIVPDALGGCPSTAMMNVARIRGRLDRAANFVAYQPRYDKQTGKLKEKPKTEWPPEQVCQDLLIQPNLPFPFLEGIIGSPIVRADGSVLTKAGYDAGTRLYLEPIHGTPLQVPDQPDQRHIDAARESILDLVSDFPFEDGASRANAIAMALTPVVLPAIAGPIPSPMIDTPADGSGVGKTTLAQTLMGIATYAVPPTMPVPKSPEEWSKSLTATLAGGGRVALFDNLPNDMVLGAPELATLLTSRTWSTRAFGTNDTMLNLPNNTMWVFTANGPKFANDLERRFFTIRLDLKGANPYRRPMFKHRLPDHALANRSLYLLSLLILARAWFAAGQPKAPNLPQTPSYDRWAEVVGGILHHAGIPGFLGNYMAQIQSSLGATNEMNTLMQAWHDILGDAPITCTGVEVRMRQNQALKDALPMRLQHSFDRSESGFTRKLGDYLRQRKGRPCCDGSLVLEEAGKDRTNVALWSVRQIGAQGAGSTAA